MSRFVINNKLYDTEKMKYIGIVKKWYKFKGILLEMFFGKDAGSVYECELYKSKKGNFLLVHTEGDDEVGEAIDESEAKELMMHYNYDAYMDMYGELEDA